MCLTALVAVSMKVTELRADRDDREGPVVGREAHAVHQHLALVERAEVAGLRIAEADDAEQLVVDRIGHRDGVGELLGRVDAVAMAHRDIRIGRRAGRLPGPSRRVRTGTSLRKERRAESPCASCFTPASCSSSWHHATSRDGELIDDDDGAICVGTPPMAAMPRRPRAASRRSPAAGSTMISCARRRSCSLRP